MSQLEIFEQEKSTLNNLLPIDGHVIYYSKLANDNSLATYFEQLASTIAWEHDVVKIFGKTHITKRKVAWYAQEPLTYKYSGMVKTAHIFTPILLEIKNLVEQTTNMQFNAVLLNFYQNGEEYMGWHSDDEREMAENSSIASVSLGAPRRFQFKHKETAIKIETTLQNGSLLLMGPYTQQYWVHRLPPATKITAPRINLTFRQFKTQ